MHTAETYNSAFQIHIWKRKTNRLHNFMNADIRSRDFGKKKQQNPNLFVLGAGFPIAVKAKTTTQFISQARTYVQPKAKKVCFESNKEENDDDSNNSYTRNCHSFKSRNLFSDLQEIQCILCVWSRELPHKFSVLALLKTITIT